ncbi:hypothetical protein M758_9G137600 [Ceratodon purpureus]|nr:hypothetical protein M758_9G137600 [Ceratodon purpureus]
MVWDVGGQCSVLLWRWWDFLGGVRSWSFVMVGEVVCQDWGQVVSCFGSVECMGVCRKCVGSVAF